MNWSANGGSLSGSSSVTGSDGRVTIRLTSTIAEMIQTSAALEGGATVSATVVSFGADAASGGIHGKNLTVSKSSAVSDGMDGITYIAVVKDAQGNPLAGQTVNWQTTLGDLSATSSVTDADGRATIILTSLQAAAAQVSASLNGKPAVNAPLVSFTADVASAQIGSGDLTTDKTSIIGNSVDAATFTAVVKDANGNPVVNHPVTWTTDRGVLSGPISNTNSSGVATVRLTGTLAGIAQVTAAVSGLAAVNAPPVSVTADGSTAQIGSGDLMADKTTALANGTEAVTYTALVRDANGNPLPNLTVNWGKDLGYLSAPASITDANGKATMTLTSPTAGSATVTAQPGSGSEVSALTVSFIADGSSARIGSGDLSVDKTTVVANSTDRAAYTALVKDSNGNPVPGHTVSWDTTKGTLSGISSVTGSDGKAIIELRNTRAEAAIVKATVNSAPTDADIVTFVADESTAKIDSVAPTKATIVGNNADSTSLNAVVTDAFGNPVPNIDISWSTSEGSLSGSSSTTNIDGKTDIEVLPIKRTATTIGTISVTAFVNGSSKTGSLKVNYVMEVAGLYYWTQNSFAASTAEATANANCLATGGTRTMNRADANAFMAAGGDFAINTTSADPKVEFSNIRYGVGGQWTTATADMSSVNTGPAIGSGSGGASGYVCVK